MARLVETVLGQTEALRAIGAAASRGRLPQSLIFYCPSGVGKKKTATALAQSLVCERPLTNQAWTGFEACGECGSCLRIEKGESESLLLIKPETRQIKIEQAKGVTDFLSLSRLGKARVVIFDDAHALNPQAGNSLLKVIEGPPPETYFFLLTPALRLVLPTLRSRSAVVRFNPIDEALLTRIYGATLAKRACGSFERAEKLKAWEGSVEALALRDLQVKWSEGRLAFLNDSWLDLYKRREKLQILFESWLFEVRENLLRGLSKEVTSEDPLSLGLLKLGDKLIWALGELQTHRDPQLLFEQFWLESLQERS